MKNGNMARRLDELMAVADWERGQRTWFSPELIQLDETDRHNRDRRSEESLFAGLTLLVLDAALRPYLFHPWPSFFVATVDRPIVPLSRNVVP